MATLLIVLALIYSWAKKPQTWEWLADGSAPASEPSSPKRAEPMATESGHSTRPAEVLAPASTDQNRSEAAEGRRLLEAVSDRTPLDAVEMPAYWRLMKWARAQSFADLERRSADHVFYTQFRDQPDALRGKLIRLRLHVRQVLDTGPAPKNSAGVERVYEARGSTDESKSYPYIVVFGELPEGMAVGDGLREEGLFVGYFLKSMAYTSAEGKRLAAPLLVGRMKRLTPSAPVGLTLGPRDWLWVAAAGALFAMLASGIWMQMRRWSNEKQSAPAPPLPDEAEMESWFRDNSGAPPGERPA